MASEAVLDNINDYEQRIQAALLAINLSGLNSRGYSIYSMKSAARDFDISYTTLQARWNGRKTHSEAAEDKMLLTPAEEAILVRWTKEMARRGMGWSPEIIMDAASRIAGKQVGLKWILLFRRRHPDIKFLRTRGLEYCRARALNRTQVTKFYDVLEDLYTQHSITPDRLYNMDEKGVQLGVGARRGIMVDAAQKSAYHIEDGNRELVTCIECVCADGSAAPTMHIYKAQRQDLEWGQDNPGHARYEPYVDIIK